MAKKMYYSEEETAAKLGMAAGDLAKLVREGKLRSYADGARKMFKADEVDAMAGKAKPARAEIELAPADSTIADSVSLTEADSGKAPTKEDTVITAEGISIFDDEDLQIEADPMAKTQIAPNVEEQAAMDSGGSGSGLLDLTRESDDTSLGDVGLEGIDMEGSAVGEGIAAEIPEPAAYAPQQDVVVVEAVAETVDAGSGLFNGLAVGMALVTLLLAVVAMAALYDTLPTFVEWLASNILIMLGISVVVMAIAGVLGAMMGKADAAKQAMRRMGS